jgi:ribosomal protein S5
VETNLIEMFTAVLSSRKFTKFFDGVELKLPDGKIIKIKIESHRKRKNVDGFRFSKFSFLTKAVSDHGAVGFGFGEGENELLTFQKSIAESIERVVYTSIKPFFGLKSSNGWAAHLTEKKATSSALNELLERDAVLVHWLTATPFLEIAPETYPLWLKTWCAKELSLSKNFNRLRLLVTHVGHFPVVQSVIANEKGFAFVSHGASRSIDTAIYRALAETCRIASIAEVESHTIGFSQESAATPWDHALAYTTTHLPEWTFGEKISYSAAKNKVAQSKSNFSELESNFNTYSCGDLFIAQCDSEKVQKLFFGRGDFALKNGLINFDRLKEVNPAFVLNELPHCVP